MFWPIGLFEFLDGLDFLFFLFELSSLTARGILSSNSDKTSSSEAGIISTLVLLIEKLLSLSDSAENNFLNVVGSALSECSE